MQVLKWLYKGDERYGQETRWNDVNFIVTDIIDNLLEPAEVEANQLRSF